MRPPTPTDLDILRTPTASSSRLELHSQDEDKSPQPAIFTIPIHATTHAPSSEYLDGEASPSSGRLAGRPLPTPDVEKVAFDFPERSSPLEAISQTVETEPSSSLAVSQTIKAKASASTRRLSRRFSRRNQHTARGGPSLRLEETPFPGLVSDDRKAITPSLPPTYESTQDAEPSAFEASQTSTPTLATGRFPRWRGWLEKRAAERHLERQETGRDETPVRKKSWGAGVDDENALSDGEDQEEPPVAREPLHVHHMGSRFISHLPSLPLCSAYLDLPPSPQVNRTGQRLLRRRVPEDQKRKVLLIGTTDGLFVAETRHRKRSDSVNWSDSLKWKSRYDGKRKESGVDDWNDTIRCRQVWSGVGVYQMSVLTSKVAETESRMSRYGLAFLSAPPQQDFSILLALCSTSKGSVKRNTGSVNGHASTGATPGNIPHTKDGDNIHLPSSYFGVGAGGGSSRTTPPSGTGSVRMWSLEALRRIISHTLDAVDASPLDLLERRPRNQSISGGKGLSAKLRRAWASLGEPSSSDTKSQRLPKQAASMGASSSARAKQTALNEYRSELSNEGEPQLMAGQPLSVGLQDEFGRMQSSPEEEGHEDDGYEEVLRLAQHSVTIKLPSGSTSSSLAQPVFAGHSDSLSSLFSDESPNPGSGSSLGHNSSATSSHSSSKGVLFFSVFEAEQETGVCGTWYMALATSKSIYLYEAARPSAGVAESRTWALVKEFYTPLPPRSIAFTNSEASRLSRSHTQTRNTAQHGRQSKQEQPQQQQVNSSAYSSVFRLHYDLSLFVSFGKKAVLISANDASVREVELDSSLLGGVTAVNASTDRSLNRSAHQASGSTALKRRSLSADLMSAEHSSGRDQWIGLERVVSEVIIRCKHHSPVPQMGTGASRVADDDDDDEGNAANEDGVYGLGVTLQDVPLPSSSPRGVSSLTQRASVASSLSPPAVLEPAHTLYAKVAVLSKGNSSHIYPLPLSVEMHLQRPLGVIDWSETPNAVTAWSRVVGLERDLSSGPISISSLGVGAAHNSRADVNSTVHLHVKVTAIAQHSTSMEMKSKRIKVRVKLPFVFSRDSELELEPILREGMQEDTKKDLDEDIEEANEESLRKEMEYACGMLDIIAGGHSHMKPWQAGGDAGLWAYDWRGADDYRLFFVGAHV